MSYARRVDANHAAVKEVFVRMLGDHVTDTSRWGEGAGDLLVTGKITVFIETKASEKKKFTDAQIKFQQRHPGLVRRCNSVEDAMKIVYELRG